MICLLLTLAAAGEFDIDAVVAKANAEARAVVVVVSSEFCQPCKQLEEEVVRAKDADAVFRHAVVVVVDEADAGFDKIKVRGEVQQFPTVLVLDKDGRERERIEGYGGHDEFAVEIGDALDGKREAKMIAALAAADDDVFRADLSRRLGDRRLGFGDERGVVDLERAVALDNTADGYIGGTALAHLADHSADKGDVGGSLGHWLRLLQRYPKGPLAPLATHRAALLFHGVDDDKTAMILLRRQLKLEPVYTAEFALDFALEAHVFVDEALAACDRAVKKAPRLKERLEPKRARLIERQKTKAR